LKPRTRCFGRAAVSAQMAAARREFTALRLSIVVFEVQTKVAYLTARLQNYVFLGGRLPPRQRLGEPSLDTPEAGRYVDCHSSELVIVGPCRRFRELSAASPPAPSRARPENHQSKNEAEPKGKELGRWGDSSNEFTGAANRGRRSPRAGVNAE